MDNDSASEHEPCESTDSEDDTDDVSDDNSLKEVASESLSDIDDVEVDSYLNDDKEKQYKKIIWELMNKKYLQEQKDKRVAATSNVTNSKGDPSHKKTTRVKKTQSTTKPACSTSPKKRPHSRINHDMLSEDLDEPSATTNSKKRRSDLNSDNEVGGSSVGTQVKDATDEYEDNENGWEDYSNYSHYNNQEEEYNYYDDDDDLF